MKWMGQTGGWRGIAAALMAAALFGMSTPLAKSILPRVNPVVLAGLLYLGSGLGLGGYAWLRGRRRGDGPKEATLARSDIPSLAGAIVAGGMVGPILLMWGLSKTIQRQVVQGL